MRYPITQSSKYDFIGESYSKAYPNLHKYPATMLPQIGIELFKELNIKSGRLLDPYCGSGSSLSVALDRGIKEICAFDINPLAVLIAKAKFTMLDINAVKKHVTKLQNTLFKFVFKEQAFEDIPKPNFYNVDFWFSDSVLLHLSAIKFFIDKIRDKSIKRLFFIPFSETVRECSYTRNSEFKLYKMRAEDISNFNPDVFKIFFEKLNKVISIYEKYYLPLLNNADINIAYKTFQVEKDCYDIVITSPPYGDSKTTVAYGQFSLFSNEWLGIKNSRQVDSRLLGGKPTKTLYQKGYISDFINEICKASFSRALQVSSFYEDLERSIFDVAESVKKGGKIIYVVGNRRVRNIQLPTDQFIAEKFEEKGFRHLITYQRLLGNKVMPLKNSPSNQKNNKVATMTKEYIVVCQK